MIFPHILVVFSVPIMLEETYAYLENRKVCFIYFYRIAMLEYLHQQFSDMAVRAEGNFWPSVLCW